MKSRCPFEVEPVSARYKVDGNDLLKTQKHLVREGFMIQKYGLFVMLTVVLSMWSAQVSFSGIVSGEGANQGLGQKTTDGTKNLPGSGLERTHAFIEVAEKSKDWSVRKKAFDNLRNSVIDPRNQDQKIQVRLAKLALDTDSQVSREASRVLMHFRGNPQALIALKMAIKQQKDDVTRGHMLSTVLTNTSRNKSEIPYFKEYLIHDPSLYVQVMAAGILGGLDDNSGTEICKQVLSLSPSESIAMLQRQAVVSAGNIADPVLLLVLQGIVKSGKPSLARSHAFDAINNIEFKLKLSKSEKLAYLKQALGRPESKRWARMTIQSMKDSEASALLSGGRK
ncbi:MAG: HEAT repeat domain-containing protein [Elusimicrobia bacterium]|nr:HEAT repeat domain-containing protein [Elusimicrobiota bacterium]